MYAFGLNLPVFEMLLVVAVIMTFCFLMVLSEIIKLRKLILTERREIKRFEDDLGNFEGKAHGKKGDERSAALAALKDYVKTSLGSGLNKDQIRGILQRRGWKTQDIDEVFTEV